MKRIALVATAVGFCVVLASPSMAQPIIHFGIGADSRPNIIVRDTERERHDRHEY